MKQPLSDKQVFSYDQSDARLNLWEGAVRSGKSFISIIRFLKALKNGPPGQAMIIGVSRDSIQRNILSELCSLIGITPPTPKAAQICLYGRTIYLVGANDERAQRRIQGATLAIAYVDELTLIPQGFFKMLLSRLSVTGAQLFGTTNPDSPFHWLRRDFLSKTDLDMKVFKFVLDDNPSLSQSYIDNLKKEYSGLWYRRYILGEWCLAEGLVYSGFDPDTDIIDSFPSWAPRYTIGIDYGTTNPTAFILIGHNPKTYPNVWVEKEYFYDSKKYDRPKTDGEHAESLQAFIDNKPIAAIYVDPSAASFKVECSRRGITNVIDADNSVLDGLRTVARLLADGTLKISRCCDNTIREFQSYVWDEKASENGKDKPLKAHDHAMDALRYAVMGLDTSQNSDDTMSISEMNKSLRARL